MSFTYDVTTDIGKVRLKIQDTVAATAQFSDEEIEVFLAETASGGVNIINLAAAAALRAWATKIIRETGQITTSEFSRDNRFRADAMLKAANTLEEEEESKPASGVAEVAVTDQEAVRIVLNKELREG